MRKCHSLLAIAIVFMALVIAGLDWYAELVRQSTEQWIEDQKPKVIQTGCMDIRNSELHGKC